MIRELIDKGFRAKRIIKDRVLRCSQPEDLQPFYDVDKPIFFLANLLFNFCFYYFPHL
jgi:hypothetical protein